jgi:hypothetical protein
MKKVFTAALLAASLFSLTQVQAQETQKDPTLGQKIGKTAKKVGHATAKTATKVGHKTSEIAAKGDAAVVDKKQANVVAPNGQSVYLNNKAQYYYVNKKGHRVYLKKSSLVAKPHHK